LFVAVIASTTGDFFILTQIKFHAMVAEKQWPEAIELVKEVADKEILPDASGGRSGPDIELLMKAEGLTFEQTVKESAKNGEQMQFKLPVLHPLGMPRYIWDRIVAASVLFIAVQLPYTLVFESSDESVDTSSEWFYLHCATDTTLLLDIVLNCRTGFISRGTLLPDRHCCC
jgi:hypothetical protein